MYWIASLTFIIALCYLWLKRHYQYWTRLGISQCDPVILLGNNWRQFFRLRSHAENVQDLYNAAPGSRYSGMYMLMKPMLLVRDPDLLKQITVKDFDFLDHFAVIDTSVEPLCGKNLLALKGQKWKDMRSTLSPAFTSSKMKYMFSLITKTGSQLVEYFLKQNEEIVTVNMKDAATKFTNDVIANAAFGVECDSLADPKNEFYVMGTDGVDFASSRKILTFLLHFLLPLKLLKFLGLRMFDPQLEAFLTRLVKENIESREKQGIVRPDMIHLLMEARKHGFEQEESDTLPDTGFATVEEDSDLSKHHKTERLEFTDEDITAQAFIFFVAGFETVSTSMCLISYELAVNPDIQKKLQQEIDDTCSNCGKYITYEALMGMKYMDMVVSEGMRKWPIATVGDRLCTKPYTIEPKLPGEKVFRLEKGEVVFIPIYGIHRDPNNFPDPERFDPERFSEENKLNIKPYTYLPFGLGPRACIGSRFALLELKVLLFNLLRSFELVPVEKTCIPLVLSKKSFSMLPDGGLWLGLKRRNEIVAQ